MASEPSIVSLPYSRLLRGSTINPRTGRLTECGQVQSGGSFDVDYLVVGPTDKTILDGTKERQGDFVFTANDVGEYRFCFNNEMSTFAEKMVDFEIAVRKASQYTYGYIWTIILISRAYRLRTKPPVPRSRPSRAPPLNRPRSLRSLFSSYPHNSPPSPATRSTSARARTATSAPSRVPRRGYSTSV